MVIRDNGWDSSWDNEADMTDGDRAKRAEFLHNQAEGERHERWERHQEYLAQIQREREEAARPAMIAAQAKYEREKAEKKHREQVKDRLEIAWFTFLGISILVLLAYCNISNRY